jgi:hypothetical protein
VIPFSGEAICFGLRGTSPWRRAGSGTVKKGLGYSLPELQQESELSVGVGCQREHSIEGHPHPNVRARRRAHL